jgi:hypothetical protein
MRSPTTWATSMEEGKDEKDKEEEEDWRRMRRSSLRFSHLWYMLHHFFTTNSKSWYNIWISNTTENPKMPSVCGYLEKCSPSVAVDIFHSTTQNSAKEASPSVKCRELSEALLSVGLPLSECQCVDRREATTTVIVTKASSSVMVGGTWWIFLPSVAWITQRTLSEKLKKSLPLWCSAGHAVAGGQQH